MVEGEAVGAIRLTEPVIDSVEAEAVQKVLESGWLVEGEVTKQFEEKVAKYVGAKYAVATCNCTVALELCLMAQDIKGEVIIPDFTHPATIQAVINAGATPVLFDVDLNSYNISLDLVYTGAKAVIPISWAGNPLWAYPYANITIEDAACSLGSQFDFHKTGSQVTTCFSFHPRKLITTGEGGMVTTNDEDLASKIRDLKNFGVGGGNYKLNDVSSAIGLAQMDKIDRIIDRRIAMAKVYDELIGSDPLIKIPQKHPLAKHTYQTYAVYLTTSNRDDVIKRLGEKGIETQVGSYALHLLPPYQNVKRIGVLENSELLHHHLLALPLSYSMTEEDQKRVVDELKNAVA